MSTENQISRKDFLKKAGLTVAGVAVTGSLLSACSPGTTASADTSSAPEWPFTYTKIDPAVAEERAYKAYHEQGGWGVGVAEGFFGVLADEVGYPYNQIPTEMFINASSGYQLGSLCGSLGVAAACIGAVCEADDAKKLIMKLNNWYKDAELPIYQPDGPLKTTVAESILCEVSVGKYKEAEGVDHGDPKRKNRCAGVAADCTRKAVELLNEHFA
jgi:hypothetical protein